MRYTFGDIVIVEDNLIGVIVKSWCKSFAINGRPAYHEVYVRSFNGIREYEEKDMRRYLVRHKELDEDELCWQANCERGGW